MSSPNPNPTKPTQTNYSYTKQRTCPQLFWPPRMGHAIPAAWYQTQTPHPASQTRHPTLLTLTPTCMDWVQEPPSLRRASIRSCRFACPTTSSMRPWSAAEFGDATPPCEACTRARVGRWCGICERQERCCLGVASSRVRARREDLPSALSQLFVMPPRLTPHLNP